MKFSFTQLGLLSVLLLFSTVVSSQVNNLAITTPDEIAGNYPAGQPVWGQIVNSFTASEAIFINDGVGTVTDGCEPGADNINGRIAFIDRGECQFGTKALQAEQAGAVAAVICNNVPLQGIFAGAAGDDGDAVTIPVFFLSFESCERIRVVAENTPVMDVEFGFFCGVPEYGPEVIWGAEPGQGDFEGGLNEWTVESVMDTSWAWSDAPNITGAFTNQPIQGTACNGYMSFPSDFYDNDGDQAQIGAAIHCPQGCTGSLFSPTIDLSNQNIDGLFVAFWHEWRVFTGTFTQMIVSYDEGITWPDTIVVSADDQVGLVTHQNPDCTVVTTPTNQSGEGDLFVPLENYDGQPTLNLQFRHVGNYYYASIDDVRLVNAGFFDIGLSTTFFGQSPVRQMPYRLAQPIPLHLDIDNSGNLTATDVEMRATATDPNGDTETYINDTYQDQPPNCFLNTNNSFTDFHVPSAVVGTHTVDYDNITPGDLFPANDRIQFTYEVTDSTWVSANRPGPGSGGADDGEFRSLWTGLVSNDPTDANFAGFDWGTAYTFYVPETGAGEYLKTVRFGVNDKSGNTGDVKIYLYLWDPEEGSSLDPMRGLGGYSITPDDLQLLGVMGENVFGQTMNSQPLSNSLSPVFDMTDITVSMGVADPSRGTPRLDSNGEIIPVELIGDQMYALVFVYNTEQEEELEMLSSSGAAGGLFDLAAYNLAMDNLYISGNIDKIIRTGATVTSTANPFIANGDFQSELQGYVWDTGYWNPNQPWIEMNIGSFETSTEDLSPELAASIDVFPNPVSDVLNIDVNLNQTTELVTFELMNVAGELVKVMKEKNVNTGTYQMNVGDVTPGIYTLNVRTESKFTSKKVVISE